MKTWIVSSKRWGNYSGEEKVFKGGNYMRKYGICISYLVSPFLIFFWKMLGFTNKHFTCFYFVILGPTGNSGMFFYDQRSTCTLPTKFVGSVAEIISSIKKFDIAAKNRKKSRLDRCIYVLTTAPLFFKTRIDIKVFKEACYLFWVWGSFFNYIDQILPIISPLLTTYSRVKKSIEKLVCM